MYITKVEWRWNHMVESKWWGKSGNLCTAHWTCTVATERV